MYDMARAQSISDRTNYGRNRVAAGIRCGMVRFAGWFFQERIVGMNNAPEFTRAKVTFPLDQLLSAPGTPPKST